MLSSPKIKTGPVVVYKEGDDFTGLELLDVCLPQIQEAHDKHTLLNTRDRLAACEHLTLHQVQVHLLESSVGESLGILIQEEVHDGPGQMLAAAHAGHPCQPAGQVGEALKYGFQKCYQVHQPLGGQPCDGKYRLSGFQSSRLLTLRLTQHPVVGSQLQELIHLTDLNMRLPCERCKAGQLRSHQFLVDVFLRLGSDILEHGPRLQPRHVGGVLTSSSEL